MLDADFPFGGFLVCSVRGRELYCSLDILSRRIRRGERL